MNKKKKRTRNIIIISVVGVIVLLMIARASGVIGKDTTQKVSTEKAEKRSIIETVSASGRIQPEIEVKISPDVSGEVVELNVKEGDEVKKGDLLAKINPDIYESLYDRSVALLNSQKASLANAKARLAQVKAQFIKAKADFNRNQTLFKKGAISQAEFDAVSSAYKVAEEEVKAAEESIKAAEFNVMSSAASVKEAGDNLRKTAIYAPMDGTITQLSIEKGERVVGTSQFAGTEIMRISLLNSMEAIVEVNENDIVRLSLGDTALIEVDAYLNRKFKGIVTEIANSASVTGLAVDQVTNFEVKIRILSESYSDLIDPNAPNLSPFRPGMSTNVEIQTERADGVLSIPIQAVTTRSDSLEKSEDPSWKRKKEKEDEKSTKAEEEKLYEYVFVYDNGSAKMIPVTSGVQDNMYIEIVKGLQEGDEVIVAPYRAINKRLKDNMNVKKVKKKELFVNEED